jgi:hypothetical protein
VIVLVLVIVIGGLLGGSRLVSRVDYEHEHRCAEHEHDLRVDYEHEHRYAEHEHELAKL